MSPDRFAIPQPRFSWLLIAAAFVCVSLAGSTSVEMDSRSWMVYATFMVLIGAINMGYARISYLERRCREIEADVWKVASNLGTAERSYPATDAPMANFDTFDRFSLRMCGQWITTGGAKTRDGHRIVYGIEVIRTFLHNPPTGVNLLDVEVVGPRVFDWDD